MACGKSRAEVKTLAIGEVTVRRDADGLLEAHTTNLTYFSRLADAETFTCQGRPSPARRTSRLTVVGPKPPAHLDLDRSYAVCATCGAGLFPLDEQLELLPGELSAILAEGVARLGTKLPFEQAVAEVAFFWGVELYHAGRRWKTTLNFYDLRDNLKRRLQARD